MATCLSRRAGFQTVNSTDRTVRQNRSQAYVYFQLKYYRKRLFLLSYSLLTMLSFIGYKLYFFLANYFLLALWKFF